MNYSRVYEVYVLKIRCVYARPVSRAVFNAQKHTFTHTHTHMYMLWILDVFVQNISSNANVCMRDLQVVPCSTHKHTRIHTHTHIHTRTQTTDSVSSLPLSLPLLPLSLSLPPCVRSLCLSRILHFAPYEYRSLLQKRPIKETITERALSVSCCVLRPAPFFLFRWFSIFIACARTYTCMCPLYTCTLHWYIHTASDLHSHKRTNTHAHTHTRAHTEWEREISLTATIHN